MYSSLPELRVQVDQGIRGWHARLAFPALSAEKLGAGPHFA
jgi:hypothetical protein